MTDQHAKDTKRGTGSVTRMRAILGHLGTNPTASETVDSNKLPLHGAHGPGPTSQGTSEIRWNGWGFADTKLFVNPQGAIEISGHRYGDVFHGAKDRTLPLLRPWAERVIGLDVRRTSPATNTSPAQLRVDERHLDERPATRRALETFLTTLAGSHPHIRQTTELGARIAHSHGQTCAEIHRLRHASQLGRVPDAVVWPQNHADVVHLVRAAAARSEDLCVVPHGGGTNVTSALECSPTENRGIVSVDLRAMDRVLQVDKENMTIHAEAGVTGLALHEYLRHRGLTLGHEPDSWEFSTLGGWVATRASGMKKNLYGNIEDVIVSLRMVTAKGTLERPRAAVAAPRVSMGPDLQEAAALGSEGAFGIITEVTLRVRPYPACQVYDSMIFPTFEHGVAAMQEATRAQCIPASFRLMDNVQFQLGQALKPASTNKFTAGVLDFAKKTYVTKIKGFDVSTMCAATVLMEGGPEEVERQQTKLREIAKRHHGLIGGAENGQRGYFFTYIIAYLRDFALDYYFMSESFETAVPWGNVHSLIHDVRLAINSVAMGFPLRAKPLIACRISQVYDTGVCVYVYFGINYYGIADPSELFHNIEHAAVEAIVRNGGSLSHHHGIGKHRRAWLPSAVSETGIAALRGIKKALDPNNVFATENLIHVQDESSN